VFGIPDSKVQELVTAVVVKREGSRLKEDELIGFVNDRLDEYKKIRGGLKFVDSIPRNPQGKILKAQLRALFN
jgi:4-coumarate--CoA ligase